MEEEKEERGRTEEKEEGRKIINTQIHSERLLS